MISANSATTGPDFQGLNDGAPFDLNNPAGTSPPLLNTTENRHRARIRARLGITANITDNFTAGFRLATGNTTNPVTTNQNLGTTLNKNNFLLDRAYIEYRPVEQATLWLGRFASPWLSNELVWDEDLNFDGVAAQTRAAFNRSLTLVSTVGAFPIETTLFNAPDNTSIKQDSRNKWLYGAQGVLGWRPTSQFELQYGVAYYRFDAIQGALSTPCVALSSADPCSSDLSRPGFLQQGNTLYALRDLVPVTANPPVFQYYGLATPFRLYNLTVRMDAALFSPWHIIADGEYVINTAFDSGRIAAKNPVNNLGPSPDGGITPGTFDGGNVAWQGRLTLGYPKLVNRWDWNVSAAYRYVESDSLVDAFTDSDFHLGGTNAKGYVIGAGIGLARNVNLYARWLSASEITGAPYSVDVVLVDLNAQF